jgi:dihydrofolate synthase/folylpolyglutamate synthase
MTFDAEQHLNSLEPIGWKLGLERMNLLCDELGRPQDRFDSIHVVGTNGKSSVARMSAALLSAHGLRAGCLVSPHLSRWSERVLVDGAELSPAEFAKSVQQTAAAAGIVNGELADGDAITQFELAVAAGFLALAEAGVEVAAIEAGLGGRLDATNTINSSVTALTSIGLDHTEWLGESELEIAGEKLAVLRPGTPLVIGALSAEVRQLARDTAAERGCRVVEADPQPDQPVELAVRGGFQRLNFAVAVAAVRSYLGEANGLDDAEMRQAASAVRVPGRLEQLGVDPPLFADVAHNRQGAAALAAALPEIAGSRPVVALVAILADKDADGILTELAPSLGHVVLTSLPPEALANAGRTGARTRPAGELAAIAGGLGLETSVEPEASAGLRLARTLASQRDGLVLVAGSHFLLAALGEFWQRPTSI